MHRSLIAVAAALCLTLAAPPAIAFADDPTPTPPASPSPGPSASPTPTTPTPTPSGTPAASPPASPSADPLIAEELERIAGARADEMRRVIAATSLLERIEAQRRLAAAERDFLTQRLEELRAANEQAVLQVAETRARADERRAVVERLLAQAYRVSRTSPLEILLRRGSVVDVVVHLDGLAALSEQEREVLEELRTLEAELARQRDEMARQEAEIAALVETVAAKDAALAELAKRAERLAAAATTERGVSEAQIALLRDMAEAAVQETEAADRLIAEIAARSGVELPTADRWTWPLAGVVTQEFGPSALALEPPRTYRGVAYPRFHEGLDIAAPLGTPVRAAARGRVAFVGHIAGGAMVVVIAHEGEHVTLYAHLDDTSAPPPVRSGDVVEAGERIGAVGLTGVTTGPHLHFVVSLSQDPIDPRVVLPTEPDRP